jgi:MFS family permease
MSAFLAPLLGFIVDRVGNRQWFLFGAAVFMFIGSSFWLMVPVCPGKSLINLI